MTYDLSNEYEVRKVLLRLNALIKKGVLVELKEQRPLRTLSQNSYLHLLLQVFAMEYGCSLDVAKVDYYKRLCDYMHFENCGSILGKGCGTLDMTKESHYPGAAYELGKSFT